MVIRLAEIEDIPKIMKFIDTYWRKDHILATNRLLFEWQYVTNNKVNIVIGIDDRETIQGILGFIPYDTTEEKDIALALWKAKHDKTFLGIKLLLYLIKEVPHRNIICTGINLQTTEKIYNKLGMKVGTMLQWYRLKEQEDYQIAKINNPYIPAYIKEQYRLMPIHTIEQIVHLLNNKQQVPYKSISYFQKRYFEHPCYQYLIYGVEKNQKITMAIVLRIQEYNYAKILRFIDCIGDMNQLVNITEAIDQLLVSFDAEYIDMYEAQVPKELLLQAGWLLVKESNNVIPNYFTPYVQSNIDIYYCKNSEKAILFKGDGDQDRPN